MGADALKNLDPYGRVDTAQSSREDPDEQVLCADEEQKQEYLRDYRRCNNSYYRAHLRLRRGIAQFKFPEGCIPPGCYQPVCGMQARPQPP